MTRSGGDVVLLNCKTARAKGASCSIGGGDRGEKGKLVTVKYGCITIY